VIITTPSLEKIFLKNGLDSCCYSSRCHNCGHETEVSITKTSGGYGLLGGILYEYSTEKIRVLCSACYEKQGFINTAQLDI